MIYVNADLHGDFSPLYAFAASEEGKGLTKDDFVIVLGDFGIHESNLEEIEKMDSKLPFTLMFLDGNHEDFPLLNSMKRERKFDAEVHDINGVYHLCRGEVLVLPVGNKSVKLAVCGGGESRDRAKRIPGKTWFEEEAITDGDVERLYDNLKKHNFTVDYFLSHVMSSAVKIEYFTKGISYGKGGYGSMKPGPDEYKVRDMIGFTKAKMYLCGHEHMSLEYCLFEKQYRAVYKEFLLLE